ncbi:hypothetical protein BJY52DRAFT_1231129 [Lactarius psammicola]|nr:hypothetical protein BJY52DRAFT_1231129 [Lactarius psammicola]
MLTWAPPSLNPPSSPPLGMAKALDSALERITNITVPADVCPSQELAAPLRDPKHFLSEPTMDISVYKDPRDNKKQAVAATPPEPIKVTLSHVATPDSTCGVTPSMLNPGNVMVNDTPVPDLKEGLAQEVTPPPLPQLTSIPLLPGLAEMLNTLQANLVTSFMSQITGLSKRIDN